MLKHSVELEQAIALMAGSVTALAPRKVGLEDCLGRTLAEEIIAPMDQPPFPRSPLDGYALIAADSTGASRRMPVTLTVVDKIFAGGYSVAEVKPGQAVRVMTGAMIPRGADCVLRQEDSNQGEAQVNIYAALRPFQNYCYQGEDFRTGTVLLPSGTCLNYAAAGILASAGITEVLVMSRPKTAVLTTGDELCPPGVSLAQGQIYNSNRFTILARLRELGICSEPGHGKDEATAVAAQMADLLERADLLITTGGISAGQKDILNDALPLMGAETVFHGVKLKPGSPAGFSLYQGKPILSLSGNPFAASVTLELLGKPLLAALSGDRNFLPRRKEGVLASDFPKASPGRRFIRGVYEDGQVTLPRGHSSGQLASLLGCNCLVDIPAGTGPLEPGTAVSVVLC